MTESEDPLFKIKEVPSMKMPGKQLKKKFNTKITFSDREEL